MLVKRSKVVSPTDIESKYMDAKEGRVGEWDDLGVRDHIHTIDTMSNIDNS